MSELLITGLLWCQIKTTYNVGTAKKCVEDFKECIFGKEIGPFDWAYSKITPQAEKRILKECLK